MRRIFVSGIGTGVGKTIAAAALVENMKADYWKPVQAGDTEGTDKQIVSSLISNNKSVMHPETYLLKTPASPHHAAFLEGIDIKSADFVVPQTSNNLVIEGAGGLMVPLNNSGYLFIDLIEQMQAEVVLVSQNYLGSINHTLLSVEAVEKRNLKVAGIIFNGTPNTATEKFITHHTGWPIIGKITHEKHIDKKTIKKYAQLFRLNYSCF